jgi:hypothetical protein
MKSLRAFSEPEVQKSLKLTADQKEKLRGIGDDLSARIATLLKTGSEANFRDKLEKIRQLRADSVQRFVSVLTPEQATTWKELTGQPFVLKLEYLSQSPKERS